MWYICEVFILHNHFIFLILTLLFLISLPFSECVQSVLGMCSEWIFCIFNYVFLEILKCFKLFLWLSWNEIFEVFSLSFTKNWNILSFVFWEILKYCAAICNMCAFMHDVGYVMEAVRALSWTFWFYPNTKYSSCGCFILWPIKC